MTASTDSKELCGITVLVTRPLHQQQRFIQLIESHGGKTASLPCLAIRAVDNPQLRTLATETCRHLIFTSVNAVDAAHHQRAMPWSLSPEAEVLAIGPATAARLRQHRMPVSELPVDMHQSEALLSMTTLQSKNLQKVAIIKGRGGRSLIENTLKERSATVYLIEVYERFRPITAASTVRSAFLNSPPNIVTITSNEALQNLVELAGTEFTETLLSLPLIVNSERGATLAHELGFKSHVLIAPVPGDQGQLDAVRIWNRSYRSQL